MDQALQLCLEQVLSLFLVFDRQGSFFQAVTIQHHFVSREHLHQYAADAAWKEDHHRIDDGGLAYRTLALALWPSGQRGLQGGIGNDNPQVVDSVPMNLLVYSAEGVYGEQMSLSHGATHGRS